MKKTDSKSMRRSLKISRRKKPGQTLSANEERNRQLLQKCNVAMIVTHGVDQRNELVNDRFTAMFGYTIEDIPDVDHWWSLAYPEEDYRETVRAEWQARVEKALRSGTDIEPMEATVRCKDGSFRHIEARLSCNGETSVVTLIDLTGRKQAEEAIRESEKRYRRIVETTGEGVWMLDATLHTSYVNPQLAKMLGYEAEEMDGRSVLDYYFPEDVEYKKQVLARRQQGLREQIEERLRRKDGSEVWVRMIANPIIRDTGEFDGALAMVADITERRRAEKALKQSEEKLSKVFRTSPTLINLTNTKTHRYLDVNDAFERITGYRREEVIGRTTEELGLWADPARRHELLRQLQKEGAVRNAEFSFRTKKGEIRTGLLSSELIEIGGETYTLTTVSDITDRKMAEEALRESEARLRLAAQVGKMYAYEWDVATDRVVRSEEYLTVLRFNDEMKHLTRQQLLDRVHPDDRALFRVSVNKLTRQDPTIQIRYRVLRPDGSVVWLEKNARAFFDEQGKMVRMIGMVADITERKLAEEALASLSGRLIEAQEQERARIARELHDDIVQRLVLVKLGLEGLENDSADLPGRNHVRIAKLREQTAKIVDDVQSLSHELHSSKLEILGLGAAMRIFCREFSEHQKVEIDFDAHDLPDSLSPIIGLCLFRVLQEALRNSTKHSSVRHFEVRSWGTPEEIHLTVKDFGAGFEFDAARNRPGLGLVSMEERLRLVKGTLSIESQPALGTTIHARVPVSSGKNSMRAAG